MTLFGFYEFIREFQCKKEEKTERNAEFLFYTLTIFIRMVNQFLKIELEIVLSAIK